MQKITKQLVIKVLEDTIDKLKADTCELSDEQAIATVRLFAHNPLSKEQACLVVKKERSRFDDYVRLGILPKGRKVLGYKELRWYEDELIEAMAKYNGE